ncbi:hypothetical protein ISCGN_024761, partial [Ixodes scapularis]
EGLSQSTVTIGDPLAMTESLPTTEREPASETAAASAVSEPLVSPVADSGGRRTRIDSTFLTSKDREVLQRQAEKKTAELSSTSATDRKMKMLATKCDAAPSSSPLTYTIVNLDAVNSLLELTACRVCRGSVSIERETHDFGLAVKLKMHCGNCGDIGSEWSSRRVGGEANCNPFAINLLAARAMQGSGNGQTALNDIFADLGISHRGLHNKTFQHYLKTKLHPAAKEACKKTLTKCATAVKEVYEELNFGNPGNIAISFDGTWHTRGHSSRIGVATVIELFSGYVLDYVVLSNFCLGCECGPQPGNPEYDEWKARHLCQKNTTCKAGQMEVEAALILFQRSLSLHSLRYTTMLCDGDSRSYHAIEEAKVYGYIEVEKEDCTNHVQKLMGTALRNLVQKHKQDDGGRISGKGRLTGDLISKLTSYYGWALKSHAGNVDRMHSAVMATYYHITSTDEKKNHSLCPSGVDSWCKHNAATAKDEPPPKHRYKLPDNVSDALLPVYQRLADKRLLRRCRRGKTQNANEALHSVIWSLTPKHKHASLFAVETAVADAIMRFNVGMQQATSSILQELQLDQSCKGGQRAVEKDCHRSVRAARKRAASAAFQAAAKRRQRGKPHGDYSPGAF